MPLRFRYFILLIMWNFVFVCCCNSCSVFFLLTSCTGWCWWFDVGYTSSWWLTFIHGILCFKLFMQHIFINYLILINSSKFKRCLYNSIETNLKSSPLKRPSRLSGFNTPCQLNTKRLHGFPFHKFQLNLIDRYVDFRRNCQKRDGNNNLGKIIVR